MQNKLLSVIFSILLLFVLLISSAELLLYGPTDWFRHEYVKYKVLDHTIKEISMEDALHATDEWMSYLHDGRDTLVIYVVRDGKEQEFFTDREKAHMADVRKMFLAVLRARNVSLAVCILIVAYMSYAAKRRRSALPLIPSRKAPLRRPSVPLVPADIRHTLCRGFAVTTAAAAALSVAAGAVLASDFDTFFTKFHELFFDNDLWLLYPDKDEMINLLPEGFFYDTVKASGSIFLALLVLFLLAAFRLGPLGPFGKRNRCKA